MPSDRIDEIYLRPIRPPRVSEAAADQITALIEEGRFSIGDRLPSERELVRRLRISRASVREALRVLESQGLIEVQANKGAFVVGEISQTEIVRGLEAWLEEHREQVQAIFEVRQVLENHAVHLATQRASPDIVAQMRDTLAEMRSYTERGMLLNATHADRKFHGLLYHASGNRFLEILGDGIVATLFEARHSILRVPGRAERSLKEHQAIVEAIVARDPERARSAMRRHVSNTLEALLALEAQT